MECERHVAREVVAADRQARSQLHAFVVVDNEIGRLRADVHQRRALVPVLRQNRSVVRGQRLENRIFDRDVRLVHRAHQAIVFLHRAGNEVRVGL